MIDWRPISEIPDEMKDGREIFLLIPLPGGEIQRKGVYTNDPEGNGYWMWDANLALSERERGAFPPTHYAVIEADGQNGAPQDMTGRTVRDMV